MSTTQEQYVIDLVKDSCDELKLCRTKKKEFEYFLLLCFFYPVYSPRAVRYTCNRYSIYFI